MRVVGQGGDKAERGAASEVRGVGVCDGVGRGEIPATLAFLAGGPPSPTARQSDIFKVVEWPLVA